jgi:transcriptional regulator with XRE-family HTH domain
MRRTHEDFDEKFGNAIRLTRIKQKLSQAELGAALAVSFQQIQKYESGANAVASTRIPDLCRALKTYPGDLFGFRCRGLPCGSSGSRVTAASER